MSEEEMSEETVWEDLPPEVKVVVYESLRETLAKYRKDAAMMGVLGKMVEAGGQSQVPVGLAHKLVAEGFALALELLIDADPDLCRQCGGYHEGEPPHPVNPKDLS
jgi:hypothetical protein